jgi:polysaccharide biosynthesis/export protein
MNMKLIIIFSILSLLFCSCRIGNEIMFEAPKDFAYDSIPQNENVRYLIKVDDRLSLKVFTNDGFRIIDVINSGDAKIYETAGFNVDYLVDKDSTTSFPIVGRVNLVGMNIRSAEDTLTSLFKQFYVDPLIQINVLNRRAIVFTGGATSGTVIQLRNEGTTLIEVLAMNEGITDMGKAKSIKIVRKKEDDFEVYNVDLSTIYGINDANMVIKNEDLIYIDPIKTPVKDALDEIYPVLSLTSSTLVIITSIITLTRL